MATEFKRIGILTAGGDAPGMNAAIRSITRAAIDKGVEVMGIYRGFKGLVQDPDENVKELKMRDVSNIINNGGTMLWTARYDEFIHEANQKVAADTCRRLGIDGVIAIGGDGTFRGAVALANQGIPTIAIPATIDNDIISTDYTIGFDTAVNTTIEMVDRLRDTCESHARCNVVEVMGRGCGDIALYAGLATGATIILIDEIKFNENDIFKRIKKYRDKGKRNFIIMASENVGAKYCEYLAEKIEKKTGIETKFARLAHVVRGGSPTLRDRLLGATMGVKAVDELLAGKSNLVICELDDKIESIDIEFALAEYRLHKKKTTREELAANFSEEQIAAMEARCLEAKTKTETLYKMAEDISK